MIYYKGMKTLQTKEYRYGRYERWNGLERNAWYGAYRRRDGLGVYPDSGKRREMIRKTWVVVKMVMTGLFMVGVFYLLYLMAAVMYAEQHGL